MAEILKHAKGKLRTILVYRQGNQTLAELNEGSATFTVIRESLNQGARPF